MIKNNTLVVGQGIAGSMVAYMLHLHRIPFTVIDPVQANTSSRIAAGMFTPVSGKRKTIQPMVLQQIPFAIEIYRAIEQLLGIHILHLHHIYQVYTTITEKNELIEKSAKAEFQKFILADPAPLPGIRQELGACEITHSGWVDCELMIKSFAQWLRRQDALIETGFLHEELTFANNIMEYRGVKYSNIIFCEGYNAVDNPFFNHEDIIPCKGELLTITYDHPFSGRILKKNGIYFIPFHTNMFKAGSTYEWNNNNATPGVLSRKFMEGRLDAMLENNFTTIDHKAAIRPTTQNREVIAKQHPRYPGMYMLNGLGTKGVLQGPWWARHIVKILMDVEK